MSVVSVFVPCYNYGRFLRDCVDSVLGQTGVEVRVLILNDCSSDETAEVAADLAADPRVEYVRHPVNRGHIATYNEGIAWADGDYTVLLSADDLLAPGALARADALFRAHPEVGMVYGGAIKFQSGAPLPPMRAPERPLWRIWPGRAWIRERCRTAQNCTFAPEVITRTALQKQLGGYAPHLPHTADLEMWLRFAAHGDVGQIADADQAFYRIHNQNMHIRRYSERLVELRERRAAFETFFATHGGLPGQARLRRLLGLRLAREAFGAAGGAYEAAEEELRPVAELAAFARSVSPWAAFTPEYLGLRLRQLGGPRASVALQALRNHVRTGGR